MQCVECKSEWKKTAYGAKHMPKQKTISNSNSFSILGIPVTFLGTTDNATFAHFMKKSMHLKTGFLLDHQVLFLLLNGPHIEKKFNGAIYSEKQTKDFFMWDLLVNRGHILAFYRPNFRLQT